MRVTLIKSFDTFFEKKSYAYKLYAMKCYAKKYCVKISLKEVMCKISVHHKNCAGKYSLESYLERKFIRKIYVHKL